MNTIQLKLSSFVISINRATNYIIFIIIESNRQYTQQPISWEFSLNNFIIILAYRIFRPIITGAGQVWSGSSSAFFSRSQVTAGLDGMASKWAWQCFACPGVVDVDGGAPWNVETVLEHIKNRRRLLITHRVIGLLTSAFAYNNPTETDDDDGQPKRLLRANLLNFIQRLHTASLGLTLLLPAFRCPRRTLYHGHWSTHRRAGGQRPPNWRWLIQTFVRRKHFATLIAPPANEATCFCAPPSSSCIDTTTAAAAVPVLLIKKVDWLVGWWVCPLLLL